MLHKTGELLAVPHSIIEILKDRCGGGVVEARQPSLSQGQRVQVDEGPFCGFDAIFEGYLAGRAVAVASGKLLPGSGAAAGWWRR